MKINPVIAVAVLGAAALLAFRAGGAGRQQQSPYVGGYQDAKDIYRQLMMDYPKAVDPSWDWYRPYGSDGVYTPGETVYGR